MTCDIIKKMSESNFSTQKEKEVLDWYKYVLNIIPIRVFTDNKGLEIVTYFFYFLNDIEFDINIFSYKSEADFDMQVLPTFHNVDGIKEIVIRYREWQLLNQKPISDSMRILNGETCLTLQDPYGHILHLTSARPSTGTSRKCGAC